MIQTGAAYESQLFEIGIFAQTSGHHIPVPSKGFGDRLADTFDAGLLSSKPFLAAVGEGKVSFLQLDQFADNLFLDHASMSRRSANGMARASAELGRGLDRHELVFIGL